MDLADILTDHVALCKMHPREPTAYAVTLTNSYSDVWNENAAYSAIGLIFKVHSGSIPPTTPVGTLKMIFRYPTYDYMYAGIEISTTQTSSSKVLIRLMWGPPSALTYSSSFQIDCDVTYCLVANIRKYGTVYYSLGLNILSTTNGQMTSFGYTLNGTFNPPETEPDRLQVYFNRNDLQGEVDIYEPIFLGKNYSTWGYQNFIPRLWSGMREIVNTYYSGDFRWYLLPPFDVMDGCAYDRAQVLNEQLVDTIDLLDDLGIDVATVDGKIVTVGSDVTSMSSALNVGLDGKTLTTIWNKIVTAFSESELGQIVEQCVDILEASATIITNLAANGEFIEDIVDFCGSMIAWQTGKGTTIDAIDAMMDATGISPASIDDTLVKMINGAFDYLEEVLP